MTVLPDWTVEIRIGTTWTDVTCDLIRAKWTVGFTNTVQNMPMPAHGTFMMKNDDLKYSPESTSKLAGLDVGLPIRVVVNDGSDVRMYTAWINEIKPDPFQYMGKKTCTLATAGFLERAQRATIAPAIQLDKTADELITYLFVNTSILPPGTDGVWLLGVAGFSGLGISTYLGSISGYFNAETGVETFPYAFDNSTQFTRLYDALKYIVDSEQGWLFTGRDGKITFYNQNHFYLDTTVDETFNESMSGLSYTYGKDVYNQITVQYNPRTLDEDGTFTLATMENSMLVRFGESVTITMNYTGDGDERVSTTDAIDPVTTTDWTANAEDDGSGADMTADFTVTAVHLANGSEWTVSNNNVTTDGYLQAGATQRSNNKLTDKGAELYFLEDAGNVVTYGARPLQIMAQLLPTAEAAARIAKVKLSNYRNPIGDITQVTLKPYKNTTLKTAAITRTIGDRITLIETQTANSDDYFIMGEEHTLEDGAKDWTVKWHLMNAKRYLVWAIGVPGRSEIGETSYLG